MCDGENLEAAGLYENWESHTLEEAVSSILSQLDLICEFAFISLTK